MFLACYFIFTCRDEVVGKVIFLHLFVILFTGGEGSASMHAGIPTLPLRADPPPGSRPDPPDQTLPPSRHPPPPDQAPPPGADTPLGSRLYHMVYKRPVRILLECILVTFCVRSRVTFELFT